MRTNLLKISGTTLLLLAIKFAYTQPVVPASKKTYCNPIVSGQPVLKRLSLSYEMQPRYAASTRFPNSQLPVEYTTNINLAHTIRVGYAKNIVVKPTLYMSFSAGYWFSSFNVTSPDNNSFSKLLSQSRFHSITASTNIFKPLNNKNYLLVNVSLEANGNQHSFRRFSGDNILAGGAIIYGWKKSFKRMWGIGIFRGYRLGKVIHVPALLYNSSFNKKWGVDALLPARANFRYSKSPKTMWLFGYEFDGTQFAVRQSNSIYDNTFLQRGEIRPKIGLEKQIGKSWAFTFNTGIRFNGRFDISSDYAGKNIVVENDPKAAIFVNAGIHIVKFPARKKK